MRSPTRFLVSLPIAAVLFCGVASSQHHPAHQGHDHGHQDGAKAQAAHPADAFYPLDTCAISGKKLGSMGDPIIKVYDGREVRFCCGGCPKRFAKDLNKSFAALDKKIAADQGPLYPTKKSIVTGKNLPARPVEFVHGNRLVRVGSAKEKATFMEAPAKYLAALDKAVVAAQGRDYPLTTCPISGEKLGGMGAPLDRVVAGRLVRLCCKGCIKKLNKNPMAAIAKVDAARAHGGDHDHDKHEHGEHNHGEHEHEHGEHEHGGGH